MVGNFRFTQKFRFSVNFLLTNFPEEVHLKRRNVAQNENWPTCDEFSKTLSHIFFIVKVMSMGLVGIESEVQI